MKMRVKQIAIRIVMKLVITVMKYDTAKCICTYVQGYTHTYVPTHIMFLFSEMEYNNNLFSINNTVVCETSITCNHIYNKFD